MIYPEEFKERVKKAYPEARRLHEALENQDNDLVSVFLTYNCSSAVKAERILECNSLGEVRNLAWEALERQNIYQRYLELHWKNG